MKVKVTQTDVKMKSLVVSIIRPSLQEIVCKCLNTSQY